MSDGEDRDAMGWIRESYEGVTDIINTLVDQRAEYQEEALRYLLDRERARGEVIGEERGSRRAYLRTIAAVGVGGGLVTAYEASSRDQTTPPEPVPESQFQPGETYGWNKVGGCLSGQQEDFVTDFVEDSSYTRTDLRYGVESDGNLLIYEPSEKEEGYEPVEESRDDNFECEVGG